jgi:hypothetical protein
MRHITTRRETGTTEKWDNGETKERERFYEK